MTKVRDILKRKFVISLGPHSYDKRSFLIVHCYNKSTNLNERRLSWDRVILTVDPIKQKVSVISTYFEEVFDFVLSDSKTL